MSVVQELGGDIAADRLHQLLFIFCNKFIENNHYYDFIPTENGPISIQGQEDKNYLIKKKFLSESDDWVASDSTKRFAVELDMFEKMAIQKMKNRLQDATTEELQQRIKDNFPAYFVGYEDSKNLSTLFCTIGYEGKSPEVYLNTLSQENVKLLCDVRKNAYSQKFGFSKKELETALAKVGIKYLHMPELGIISEKRQNLDSKKAYNELFDEYENTTIRQQQSKLDELVKLLEEHKRIAITCFEKDVYCCHRSRVVKALKVRDDFDCQVKNL